MFIHMQTNTKGIHPFKPFFADDADLFSTIEYFMLT